jgi:flagellar biosynthesis GTPase FlhF
MPRKKKKEAAEEKRDINQTLDELGLDKDLEPEAAASAMKDEDQRALDAAAQTPTAPIPDLGEEANTTVEVQEVTPLKGSKVKPTPPAMAPIPEPPPLAPVAPPPPAPKPKAKGKAPGVGSKLGAKLGALAPGSERVKVYKRIDGKLGYIQDFNARDLDGYSDIESFLDKYIKPDHGPGEYVLQGVDAHAREIPMGSVLLLGKKVAPTTPAQTEASGAFGFARMISEQNQEWMQRMMQVSQPQPQKDPIETLQGLMALQENLSKKGEAAQREAREAQEAAKMEANNANTNMMQMFMASMQQQSQQMQQQAQQNMQMMMAILSQPKEPDPIMQTLLAKLVEDKASGGGNAAVPPPPPPPPQQDPVESLAKLMAIIVPLMGGGGGGDDESKELLKSMLEDAKSNQLGPRDMLALISEMKGDRGTDDFKKSADNLAMMLNITNQLRNSTEGSASAGFWDALGALFSNRDFAGSIAQQVRTRATQQQGAMRQTSQQEAQMRHRALMAAEEEKRRLLAAQQAQEQQEMQDLARNSLKPKGESKKERKIRKKKEEAHAKAKVSVPETPEVLMPPLPPNIPEYLNNINEATDDAALLETTLRMLVYMSAYDEWSEFTQQLIGLAQEGQGREMMQ